MEELREKYLQGKLSGEERKTFESSLTEQDRADLRTELAIKEAFVEQLRGELRAKVQGFEKETKPVSRFSPAWMGIAATVLLVVASVYIFRQEETSLFESYYTSYPNYELTTVRGEKGASLREQAYAAYDSGSFQDAIAFFEQIEQPVTADWFFLALSRLEIAEEEQALADLQKVISTDDTMYLIPAKWYAALILIEKGQSEQAKLLLRDVRANKGEFYEESVSLLQEI